jgi:alkylresorcinol/alkylpyrone synthase
MSRILGLGTALPQHRVTPAAGREALRRVFPRLRGIDWPAVTRYTTESLDQVLAPRGLGEAMGVYAREAPRLAADAARQALARAGMEADELDVAISVSCTGYLVPSLDVTLMDVLGMRRDVIRLPITELGCSGGLAAVAAAHRHLLGSPRDRVLVVAVELCSLTFQPGDRSLDNLTASLVFGDGAAAAVLDGGTARPGQLEVVAAGSRVIPGSTRYLGFELRDGGFHVVLDPGLARLIAARLPEAVGSFRARHRLGAPTFHLVHAGGPRIFDAVEASLGLAPEALAGSRALFCEIGNVSSASVLFGLDRLDGVSGDGLVLAFGPGVTVELAWVRRSP